MQRIENLIFASRAPILGFFLLFTMAMAFFAAQLRMETGFEKLMPLGHPFMETYRQHAPEFGGGNRVLVVLENRRGDIFTPEFLEILKKATEDVFFIPGVERSSVKSLWTPNTRYLAVTEEGLEAGDVIPADFRPTPQAIRQVASNVLRADLAGRLVSTDFRAAMIEAELIDVEPGTGERLDYLKVADRFEKDIRGKYENAEISVKIIGFAKLAGDIAHGASSIFVFFGIAFALTALMLFLYCRSLLLTALTLFASLCSLIWQFGILHLMGFGLDPLAVLVPFLVFAIGVSHGVQQINMASAEIAAGHDRMQAARATFRFLLRPGGVALLTCVAGFAALYVVPIGMIRDLAVTASIGVLLKIFSNLVMLPLLISYAAPGPDYGARIRRAMEARNRLWPYLADAARLRTAFWIVVFCASVGAISFYAGLSRQIGDTQAGTGELRASARYNQDSAYVASHFTRGLNVLSVIGKSDRPICVDYPMMSAIDRFGWKMGNAPGVAGVSDIAGTAKGAASLWQEGNLKWQALPHEAAALGQATTGISSGSLLANADCSISAIHIHLTDTKAETVRRVVGETEAAIAEFAQPHLSFLIGAGNVAIIAATNNIVEASEVPMLVVVYLVVGLLVLVTYRDWRGALCCVLPLILSTSIGNWFLTAAGIGLKISTLPVLAIAVGIGVDYGIYEYNRIQRYMRMGLTPYSAYLKALNDVGSATLFTGLTLAIGVSTWIFSPLKFQADMGMLLTFMFLANMIGAVTLLPALVAIFEHFWPRHALPLRRQDYMPVL